jgi:hypothetical protein
MSLLLIGLPRADERSRPPTAAVRSLVWRHSAHQESGVPGRPVRSRHRCVGTALQKQLARSAYVSSGPGFGDRPSEGRVAALVRKQSRLRATTGPRIVAPAHQEGKPGRRGSRGTCSIQAGRNRPRPCPTATQTRSRPGSLHPARHYGGTGPRCVEVVGTPRAGCGVSLRAEDCTLGAGPTIYERSADA